MAAVVMVSGLFFMFCVVILNEIQYGFEIHHQYMMDRAMKLAIVESYEAETESEAMSIFESSYKSICPQQYRYEIYLKNYQSYPKMVHFEVVADGGFYQMEEILIEEEKDAS